MLSLYYGFIVAVNVAFGGAGYSTAPMVTITDASGSNAVVTANISGGAVVSFNILNNGKDYSSSPAVNIGPPPANMAYVTYWSHDGTSVNGSEPATTVPARVFAMLHLFFAASSFVQAQNPVTRLPSPTAAAQAPAAFIP
jgi:hypothetical protein